MKKHFLLIVTVLISAIYASAQWASGGTQLTFGSDADHKMYVTVDSHAGYYATWMALDQSTNLTAIRLGGYDSASVLKTGWPAGGITVSDSGNNFAPQILTSEDDGVIIAWYGFVEAYNRTHIYVQKYSPAGVALWNGGNPVQ